MIFTHLCPPPSPLMPTSYLEAPKETGVGRDSLTCFLAPPIRCGDCGGYYKPPPSAAEEEKEAGRRTVIQVYGYTPAPLLHAFLLLWFPIPTDLPTDLERRDPDVRGREK